MLDILTPEETERWDGIKKTFNRNTKLGNGDIDPVDRLVRVLVDFGQGLGDIRETITKSAAAHSAPRPSVTKRSSN